MKKIVTLFILLIICSALNPAFGQSAKTARNDDGGGMSVTVAHEPESEWLISKSIPKEGFPIVSVGEDPSRVPEDLSQSAPVLEQKASMTVEGDLSPHMPVMKNVPIRLMIPSINLDVPISEEGLDEEGRMAVPDGRTNYAGWYKDGTKPGERGSAVLSAHVYAGFKSLNKVAIGSEVYVLMQNGEVLRFIVKEKDIKALGRISADELFNRSDAIRLNLVTCSGKFDPILKTYDHRLIVSAILSD